MSVLQRYLTLKEVREMFAISTMTVWRWINERGLKVVRVGGVVRIRQSDLDAFIAKHDLENPRPSKEAELRATDCH